MIADAVRSCRQAGLECGLFHEVKDSFTGKNVDDGVARYREGRHEASSRSAAAGAGRGQGPSR